MITDRLAVEATIEHFIVTHDPQHANPTIWARRLTDAILSPEPAPKPCHETPNPAETPETTPKPTQKAIVLVIPEHDDAHQVANLITASLTLNGYRHNPPAVYDWPIV